MAGTLEIPGWAMVKTLGSGAFGDIALWRNIEGNYEVAVKSCHRQMDRLTSKQIQYWTAEVEMMMKMDHPNVVKAIELPDDFKKAFESISPLPLLGMEFCSGGSLRSVLRKKLNYCGFEEATVRNILHDICSGLSYLHSKDVIHRDIKPENIVVQPREGGRELYKLIDLGYSKHLENTHHMNSFVGTMYYVAPEIYEGKPYTVTADYWSLGILAYELLTGQRPFVYSCGEFMKILDYIKNKPKDVIRITVDAPQQCDMSTQLPQWCPVSERFKKIITEWLRMMLSYYPSRRYLLKNPAEKPTSLDRLLEALDEKVVRVMDVSTLNVCVLKPESRDEDLYIQTMITEPDRLILSPKGKLLSYEEVLDLCSEDDGEVRAFLYNKKGQMDKSNKFKAIMPNHLTTLAAAAKKRESTGNPKSSSIHCLVHMHRQHQKYLLLRKSYEALVTYLNSKSAELASKLKVLGDASTEFRCYRSISSNSRKYDDREMQKAYHSAFDGLMNLHSVPFVMNPAGGRVQIVQGAASALRAKMESFGENPLPVDGLAEHVKRLLRTLDCFSKANRPSGDVLAGIFDEIVRVYEDFRTQILKDDREVSLVLNSAMSLSKEFEDICLECDKINRALGENISTLKTAHQSRDVALWNTIKELILLSKDSKRSEDVEGGERVSSSVHRTVTHSLSENEYFRDKMEAMAAQFVIRNGDSIDNESGMVNDVSLG